MEEFKTFEEISRIDERHILLGQLTGYVFSLQELHKTLAEIKLHDGVPDAVHGQFNVARNMALYYYFQYSLAPEVQMKTYSVIELALKKRFPELANKTLAPLLKKAVSSGLLKDTGDLVEVLSKLRNHAAHGSADLTPHCIDHIEKCADIINQLFTKP